MPTICRPTRGLSLALFRPIATRCSGCMRAPTRLRPMRNSRTCPRRLRGRCGCSIRATTCRSTMSRGSPPSWRTVLPSNISLRPSRRSGSASCFEFPRRSIDMAVRFDDIGNRLKAFRLGSGLSADEIAAKLGISRTALYRFEKGELAKIETLEKLAELLGVSIPTLLGVGVEYIGSAVAYFERMRQIEERCEHIIVLAGPISYLLASDRFEATLEEVLRESVPERLATRKRALEQVDEIMTVLRQRKASYRQRQPGIVNLIASSEMERFLS